MLHVTNRQVRTYPLRYLARKATGGVDHALGDDLAFFRNDLPFARGQWLDVDNAIVLLDFRTHFDCAARHRVAQPGRIGVTVVPGPGTREHTGRVKKRIEFLDFVNADDFQVETRCFLPCLLRNGTSRRPPRARRRAHFRRDASSHIVRSMPRAGGKGCCRRHGSLRGCNCRRGSGIAPPHARWNRTSVLLSRSAGRPCILPQRDGRASRRP